jgi:hypothetical protein
LGDCEPRDIIWSPSETCVNLAVAFKRQNERERESRDSWIGERQQENTEGGISRPSYCLVYNRDMDGCDLSTTTTTTTTRKKGAPSMLPVSTAMPAGTNSIQQPQHDDHSKEQQQQQQQPAQHDKEGRRHKEQQQLLPSPRPLSAAASSAADIQPTPAPTLNMKNNMKEPNKRTTVGMRTRTSSSTSSSSSSSSTIGLVTFEQVLDLIPTQEKGAYLQAMQRCPELVATESDPCRFLIRDDYNVWAAARRLVAYWEARRELFGETRAYRPILVQNDSNNNNNNNNNNKNQQLKEDAEGGTAGTKGGALDEEDWAALATGWYALLPRTRGGRGHAVLAVDFSRANQQHYIAFGPLARSAFYIRTVMSLLDLSQTEGYIAVTTYNHEAFRALLQQQYQRLAMLLFDVFPIKIKVSFMVTVAQWQFFQHVLPILERVYNSSTSTNASTTSSTSSSSSSDNNDHNHNNSRTTTTTTTTAQSSSSNKQPTMLVPLVASSHQELLRKLEPHHLTKHGLPPRLGGTWSYDIFTHWVASAAAQAKGGGETSVTTATAAAAAAVHSTTTSITTALPPLTDEQAAELDSFRQSYSSCSSSSSGGNNSSSSSTTRMQQRPSLSISSSSSSSCSSLDEMAVEEPMVTTNSSCPSQQTTPTSQLLTDFYEALDLIPFEQKQGYIQAMQHSAALVQEESDPKMFLACEQDNPQAAARRFVNYWNLRLSIFGPHCAYLPLVAVADGQQQQQQQSSSALSAKQIAEFHSGAYIILPPDKHGRVVHMSDRSKSNCGSSYCSEGTPTCCCRTPEEIRQTKLACWFYFLTLACRQMMSMPTTIVPLRPAALSCSSCNSSSSSSSNSSIYSMHMVCLVVVGPEFFDQPLLASLASEIKHLTTALPVRHVDIHIICLPSSSPSRTRIVSEDKLAFMVDRFGRNTNVHVASCPQEMRVKLQEKVGMRPEGIPVDFGGMWTMEKEGMAERHERVRIETQRLHQFRDTAPALPAPPLSSSLAATSLIASKHPHRRRLAVTCDVVGCADSRSSGNQTQQEQQQQQQQQQNKRLKTSVEEINMLQDAIDKMPLELKKDYLFASKNVPRLVQTETNPEMFLSFEPGRDCVAAANRITAYWRKRREIFGQDRAFSPMHLKRRNAGGDGGDGDGGDDAATAIMSPADVAALRQGFVAFIPKHAKNNNKINCLWLGRRRGLPRETWLRILFYMLHVATENTEAEQEILHALSEDSPEDLRILDGLMRDALPVRIAATHLFCVSPTNTTPSEKGSIEVLLPAAMHALSKPLLDHTCIYMVQTEVEMCTRLEWCGFCREKLPTEVGGSLELEGHIAEWIENMQSTESLPCQQMIHASSSDQLVSSNDIVSCNPDRSITNKSESEEKDWHTALDEASVGVMRNSRCRLDEAIDLMPEEDTQAYCEALATVPDIVEHESRPSWYLQHEKYNSWAAANRLALYWTKRKRIFGDRAFLPMNLTGEGALSKEGVGYFSTGALVFLPSDKNGRSVLCYDPSRGQGVKIGTLLELMFYVALICAENRKSPIEGVVLLVITSKASKKVELGKVLDVVSVFPFTWQAIHVISMKPEKAFLSSFAFWDPVVLGSDRFRDRVIVHEVNSNEAIVPKLAAHGISEAYIPESCGGTWSYLQHARWQEQRIRLEWDLPVHGSEMCSLFASNAKPRCELNENERTERRRRFNVVHSRRKRERDKVEREVLRKHADDLKSANLKIKMDNQRIEGLIRAAEAEVQLVERYLLQPHAPLSCYGFSHSPTSIDAGAVPPRHERNFSQGTGMRRISHSSFPTMQTNVAHADYHAFCNEQHSNNTALQNQNAYALHDSLVSGGVRDWHSLPTNHMLHAGPTLMNGASAPVDIQSNSANFSWQPPALSTAAMFHTNDATSMALANGRGLVPPRPHQRVDSQFDELSRRIAALSNGFAPADYQSYPHAG